MEDDGLVPHSGSGAKDGILDDLLSMGFAMSAAVAALTTEGVDNLADAVEFLLAENSSHCQTGVSSTSVDGGHRQSPKATSHRTSTLFAKPVKHKEVSIDGGKAGQQLMKNKSVIGNAWVENFCAQAKDILSMYFGFRELKPFQLEALEAWANHQDCLVLAATGSGKSLCFQLPALLTGKVSVVVSPLISLMHDQCQQLSKRGIAACFLGSGQSDKTVEKKAMTGMYSIVYVCPETLPRLVDSLKELVHKRGLALFAIDEAHCISKWGHDFRPDYRRLSTLREVFQPQVLLGLKETVPIMALTATATDRVQLDIMKSLKMDLVKARIVQTTLFRPNLRFSVHHSKTCKPSSYEADFKLLLSYYMGDSGSLRPASDCFRKAPSCFTGKCAINSRLERRQLEESCKRAVAIEKMNVNGSRGDVNLEVCEYEKECAEGAEDYEVESSEEVLCRDIDETEKTGDISFKELTVDFLEDDYEDQMECLEGDFEAHNNECSTPGTQSILAQNSSTRIEHGPSIVYAPTRRETESIARFLCQSGLKAAPYHSKLPKAHLHNVHEQFHHNNLQVVVATIAFGMGIDKPDVRHVIHYGWPQSLEAYYQEAGRAGRDGLPSECMLYCDMTVLPSLLPSRRDQQQTQRALHMLEQCFRYGLSTSRCRADALLNYFGEDLPTARCEICDFCTNGPPCLENLTLETEMLLSLLSSTKEIYCPSMLVQHSSSQRKRHANSLDNKQAYQYAVNEIAECGKLPQRNHLWWRGFCRVLADSGFLKEGSLDRKARRKLLVQHIRNPEVTAKGQKFLVSRRTDTSTVFCVHPQGDMIQALVEPNRLSSHERAAHEWGRGWADPEIRKQRLARRKLSTRQPRGKRRR